MGVRFRTSGYSIRLVNQGETLMMHRGSTIGDRDQTVADDLGRKPGAQVIQVVNDHRPTHVSRTVAGRGLRTPIPCPFSLSDLSAS